jgi:predicted acyl esterase
MQRRFFDHYLTGLDNGWENEPPVTVEVRSAEDGIAGLLTGERWPLPAVQWSRLHLDLAHKALSPAAGAEGSVSYPAIGEGVTLLSAPLERECWLAGPVRLRIWVASDTADLDLFATLRAFDGQGRELTFYSAIEPRCPVSQGWLRASHRKLDTARTNDWRPVHTHDEAQPLTPGEAYALEVEIWATSVAVPAGGSLALTLQGCDFERPNVEGPFKGSGFFTHESEADRPAAVFGGQHTIMSGGERQSWLQLPIVGAPAAK